MFMDTISINESPRRDEENMATLEMSGNTQLPESTSCLSCSEDGVYLSLGHSGGLSVWSASSLVREAEWLEDSLEIVSIQMTSMAETAYLLGTVDDMGVARVFAFHSESIDLLKVINVMEDIEERIMCLSLELSRRGNYGAALISCSGAVSLDIYHFPIEAWLKELKMAASQKQAQEPDSSELVEINWSPVSLVIKIQPPEIPADPTVQSPPEVLENTVNQTEEGEEEEDQEFSPTSNNSPDKTKAKDESTRRGTLHYLLPCPYAAAKQAKSQPGLPVAVCIWWTGSHNLLQYLLGKAPKNKADVDPMMFCEPQVVPMPDASWLNGNEILCSAVSSCTRYIALGLDDSLVNVWDRQTGSPLRVVLVTAADSAFFRLHFVDDRPVFAADSLLSQTLSPAKVHLLVLCKSGAIHTVIPGRGAEPFTMQLTGRPEDNGSPPAVVIALPFLQGVALVVQRNGKMFLQDVIKKTTVCLLICPKKHCLASPWDPVLTLNTKRQTLFIRGDQEPSVSPKGDCQSLLFTFSFGEPDVIKNYIISLPDSLRQQKRMSFVALEEACNHFLHERELSLDERNKALRKTWEQLKKHAAMVQQRHSSTAARS
ncbi:WD repeat-containing protein 93 [Genypterus blacodes]|uniref:WD repeat-containing protein 93 n=1 Tax=Genypterus blacodes TaxID=154954 RepID=UPI003F75ECD4